jgi:hypothetical protein
MCSRSLSSGTRGLGLPLRVALLMTLVGALSACEAGTDSANAAATHLADREAIEMTLERYTRGLDRLDPDLYVSSFSPDGVLMIYEKAYRGHDALRAIVAAESRLRQSQKDAGHAPRTLFHLETNSTVEFASPVRAEHRTYWLTATRTADKPEDLSLLGVGSSVDELQKIDGKWLITRREIRSQP